MAIFIAEDIRNILNKLDEYVVAEKETGDQAMKDDKDGSPNDDNGSDGNENGDKPIDSMLTDPVEFKTIPPSMNGAVLVKLFDVPEEFQDSFMSGITALKSDDPKLNTSQLKAFAISFNRMLTMGQAGRTKAVGTIRSLGQSAEPINEQEGPPMEVEVLFYNSGHGERLDAIANDPKRRRKVHGSLMMNPSSGAPQLKFTEKGETHPYYADWTKHGWAADLD